MKINTRSLLMFAGAVLVGYVTYNLWQRSKSRLSDIDEEDAEFSGFMNIKSSRRNRFYGQSDSGTCPPSCEFPPSRTSRVLSN